MYSSFLISTNPMHQQQNIPLYLLGEPASLLVGDVYTSTLVSGLPTTAHWAVVKGLRGWAVPNPLAFNSLILSHLTVQITLFT